ncbi:alkaline phosphatase PhoX [Mangrovimonas sp. DI 80]|uniref:alkaline phosphatase PhoX n=1 Tax=Mangrovimonas sp. DI 80 TaxID=1779330 RepID=UPI000975F453|nr:alkaline phosphatase PhoX [Mangrovimonas sp. DI 80]OMP30531.1 phosphatase [Mangrovimonas sp. DI 80]
MKKIFFLSSLAVCSLLSCDNEVAKEDLAQNVEVASAAKKPGTIQFQSYSSTPSLLEVKPGFKNIEIYPILSSEDVLENSPEFVYGSMADGAGLLKNDEGTYTLINNIEADYSIARITLNENFKPVHGEYILNAEATGSTAQCSGSLITPEEHGFGPLYLSGGEWGGASKGVFVTNPYKDANDASVATMLPAMGQWSTENAVAIGKDAYPGKTVVFIGDDHSDNVVPSGQLGMYVGNMGDLDGGNLYGLKVTDPNVEFEMDMEQGQSYPMEFVQLEETEINLLDAECKAKGVMGFSRLEDIDWRKGSAENNREIYFCVTGRKKNDLVGKGSIYGRVYKVTLNPEDPTQAGTITCILDGDIVDGEAKRFHSPDNIVVTENYIYIQEDPNGYWDSADKQHFASLYEYSLNSYQLKTVLECNQTDAQELGYGTTNNAWEITGMIDISDVVGVDKTFLLITQNHGWVDPSFTDPNANPVTASNEGSMLYVVKGLKR